MLVLGIAGGTETGMVDDLEEIGRIAKENHAHFHVDAAYGGPYILTRESARFSGINQADSITVDPHKMLYTPYESGVILFKDKNRHALITKDFLENAGYLVAEDVRKAGNQMDRGRNYGSSRPSGSMGSGGAISTWATMKLFGNEGIQTILGHTLKLTDCAYQRVSSSNVLQPLHKAELNTLLISLKNTNLMSLEANNFIVDQAINSAAEKGYCISCDDEVTHGRKILRFVAMHPYSTTDNVNELITILEESIDKTTKNVV
jgi:glutamate/tyrosine decarboxylase-like PLP-dependent enzyme